MDQSNEFSEYLRDQVRNLHIFVDETNYWTEISKTKVNTECRVLANTIRAMYQKQTTVSLEESCRQLIESNFTGDLQLFVYYFNAILHLQKLKISIQDK